MVTSANLSTDTFAWRVTQHHTPGTWPRQVAPLSPSASARTGTRAGHELAISWARAGHELGTSWPRAGHELGTCWPQAGHKLATCWPRAGHTLATRWPLAGHVLPGSQLFGCCDSFPRLSLLKHRNDTISFDFLPLKLGILAALGEHFAVDAVPRVFWWKSMS